MPFFQPSPFVQGKIELICVSRHWTCGVFGILFRSHSLLCCKNWLWDKHRVPQKNPIGKADINKNCGSQKLYCSTIASSRCGICPAFFKQYSIRTRSFVERSCVLNPLRWFILTRLFHCLLDVVAGRRENGIPKRDFVGSTMKSINCETDQQFFLAISHWPKWANATGSFFASPAKDGEPVWSLRRERLFGTKYLGE